MLICETKQGRAERCLRVRMHNPTFLALNPILEVHNVADHLQVMDLT